MDMNTYRWFYVARAGNVRRCGERSCGFTLVELLVVIAIVSLLMAIVIPSMSSALNRARLVSCGAQMRQFGVALQFYAADNRGYILPVTNARHWSEGDTWDRILMNQRLIGSEQTFHCPAHRTDEPYPRSYTVNAWIALNDPNNISGYRMAWQLADIPRPALTVYMQEQPRARYGGQERENVMDMRYENLCFMLWPGNASELRVHHGIGDLSNVLFVDGHVEVNDFGFSRVTTGLPTNDRGWYWRLRM